MRAILFLLLAAALAQPQPVRDSDEFPTAKGAVKITAIHHASLMIQGGGTVIHIDPFSQGDYTGLPMADLILITHDHFDHMDAKALALVRNSKTVVVGPAAVAASVPGTTVLANGETRDFGDWKIEAVPAYNLVRGPSAGQLFHPKGRGNGYVLTFGGKRFEYGLHFSIRLIRAARHQAESFIQTPHAAAHAHVEHAVLRARAKHLAEQFKLLRPRLAAQVLEDTSKR